MDERRRCCTGFWTALVSISLIAPATAVRAAEPAADNPTREKPVEEVDAGTKKLLAAQGLYQRGLFKLAAQEYADFLSENPGHAQRTAAIYALGLCQYRQNDLERAAALMTSALKDPAFAQRAEALAVLGQCELAVKHYERALAAFDELLAKHAASPHADTAAINRVQAYYALNKHAEAADAARKYLENAKGAQRPAAMYFLALAERALNHPDQTIAAVDQLLRDYADSPYAADAAMLAGQCLESMGKLDNAIDRYKRMLALAPDSRKNDARYCLGVGLYKAGKYEEAIAALSGVTDGACAKPAALQLGLAQLAAARVSDARATLRRAAGDDDSARANAAKYGLARCDMADKSFDSARAILGELLRVKPPLANASQIALDRAVCAMESGKWEEAAGEFEAIARDFGKSAQVAEALYRQTYCLHRLKKFDASHSVCAAVAKLPPSEFTGAAAELDAENLLLLAKYAEAGKAFATLAQDAKDERRRLQLSVRVGQCAYFAGDYAKAVELLGPLAKDPRVASTAELQVAVFLLGDALLQQAKYTEAAEALARFVDVAKGNTDEARFKLALARLRSKDDEGARKALSELAKSGDDSPWVQRGLVEYGQLLRKVGKGAEAASALKRVLAAASAPPELVAPATYLLAWVEFDAKRYLPAAALWKQLIDHFPKHALAADAAYRRGVALKEAGEMEQAAAALQAFAAANPQSPDAIGARQLAAACLSARGKTEEAGAVLASLSVDPKATDTVLYDLAWAQREQKQTSAAEQTYRRLLKEHPDSKVGAAARTELAELLYEEKKYDQAVELLEAVVANEAAEPKLKAAAYYRLGWCYQKLSKPAKAAEAFAKYDPKQAGGNEEVAASALLQAGLAYAEQGKLDAAERSLASMLEQHPKNPQAALAMLRLGEVQAEEGKYEQSRQTYGVFLKQFAKDPFAPRAQFGIGWSLENQKKYDDARDAYKKVIARSNGETAARAQFQIGETFLAESKFNEAIPALLAVEDVYAYPVWSARALVEAGRAFEELKQPDQARKQYEQVSSRYKESAEAELARGRLKAMGGGR
jgi:TolA-binding protein